jgi:hypothetical protein
MRWLVGRIGETGAAAAALAVALGACAIGASVMVPADLGGAENWVLAIGVLVVTAGLAYLTAFYRHRDDPPR